MSRRPWTSDEDADLRRMVAARLSEVDIAAALRRSAGSIRHRTARLGCCRFRKLTPDEKARAADLIQAGDTDGGIAAELGRSCAHTVRRVRSSLGIPYLSHSEANRIAWERRKANKNPHEPTPAEARALTTLANGPLSVREAAQRIGVGRESTKHRFQHLRRKGLAFCEGKSGANNAKWCALGWWLEHNDGLVYTIAHRIQRKNPWCDVEDVASEVRLTVAKCVHTFRPTGVKFATYVSRAAEHNVLQWAALQRSRGMYVPFKKRFDVSAVPHIGDLTARNPKTDEWDEIDLPGRAGENAPPVDPDFWEKAVAGLDKRAAELVLGHYRDGRTLEDIGREHGITREGARQALARALHRIRMGRSLDEFTAA